MEQSMMKVKVQYGSDIRRWRYPETKRYQNLMSFIIKTFNFLHGREFYVQFEDDEGDRLTLTSETDFEDAFSSCEQEGRKSLKIFVMKGSIEDAHNESRVPISIPTSPQVSISNDQNSLQNDEKEEKNIEEKSNQQQSSNQNANCCNWRQLVIDFLQNKEIELLLPQLVRRVVVEFRKQNCVNNNDNNSISKKSVLAIVNEVLNEEKFRPVVKHELFQNKIKSMLPCVANKMEMYQHVLLAFNEDAIDSWVPHLINVLKHSIGNFENIDISLESDGDVIWNPFMNIQEEDDNDEVVHHDVTCDSCNQSPIRGVRYKCSVCNNYDLCANCESFGKHDSSHPLLKFLRPVDHCSNSPYYGLHETVKLFGPQKRWHGGCPWRQHRSIPRRCHNSFQRNQRWSCYNKDVSEFAKNCHKRSETIVKEETNEQNKINKSEKQSNSDKDNNISLGMRCKCGELLVKMAGREAYQGSNLSCDNCGVICSKSVVYHCPAGRNAFHLRGYDLCSNCAQCEAYVDNFNVNNNNNNNNNDELIPSEVHVNPIVNMENSNLKPEIVEMESKNNKNELQHENENENNLNNKNENQKQEIFEFQESLNCLKEMGFENERIKTLLIKHKGQLHGVIQELIQ